MSSSTTVDPGVEYQAAVGAYVGALLTGVVALALVVGDVSSGALLSLLPSVFTAGLLIGAILAWTRPATAVRLGSLRWPIALCCLPALVLGAAVWSLSRTGIVANDWRLLPAALAAIGAALAGWVLGASARDSYVESVVDEPVASWTWELSGPDYTLLGWGLACFVVGVGCSLAFGDPHPFVILLVVGLMLVLQGLPVEVFDDDTVRVPISIFPLAYEAEAPDFSRGEFRVADAGLVVAPSMQPAHKSLIPWERITGVRLTDEELVLERRRKPAIRCDRSVIDEPAALEATLRRYVLGGRTGVDSNPEAKRERNRTDP